MKPDKGLLLHLHEEVYVEPTAGSSGFHTFVVGLKPGQCVLLEHPFKESDVHPIKVGDILWVRCFQHAVFRFKARILRIIKDPIPLIFLEFPKTVEEINLRASDRKKIFIKGTFLDLQNRAPDRSCEGYILDISESGCLMWGDFVHLVDRDILLTFRVPWTGEQIQAKARVIRCEVTDKGIRSGLKFIEVKPEAEHRLRDFIETLKENHLHRMAEDNTES